MTLQSCLEWLTRSYVIGDGMGRRYTSSAEITDDLPACNNDNPLVEPHWYRRQKFYKVTSGKSIRSLTYSDGLINRRMNKITGPAGPTGGQFRVPG